jgi:hypothetical protein
LKTGKTGKIDMKIKSKLALTALGFTGLLLIGTSGCQTHIGGMTLPSGHYLEHPPQYVPPSPFFPLSKELASMETGANNNQTAASPSALPAPLPGPGGMGAGPAN